MHNFKKAVKTTVLFLLTFILLSELIMAPYFMNENYSWQDARERKELAGSIDYLVSGSSHARRAFVTQILDEKLGVNSYNLAGPAMTMQARADQLEKELERNPVKTVVIELSVDAIRRDRRALGTEGDLYYLSRLDSPVERLKFIVREFAPSEYSSVYGFQLEKGINSWGLLILGRTTTRQPEEINYKGHCYYVGEDRVDVSADPAAVYNTEKLKTNMQKDNIECLQKMVKLSKEKGAEVILVATPVADSLICKRVGYDAIREWYEEFAEENEVEFYDFNLLKNRKELFFDTESYRDDHHLYNEYQDLFTEVFADVMQRAAKGEDVTELFYSSYEEYEKTQDYYPAQ